MESLKFYLPESKDYIEGSHSVERLMSLYRLDPKRIENLWKKATEDSLNLRYGGFSFSDLLNNFGLFVHLELPRGVYYLGAQTILANKDLAFTNRIFSHMPNHVAVLKIVVPSENESFR